MVYCVILIQPNPGVFASHPPLSTATPGIPSRPSGSNHVFPMSASQFIPMPVLYGVFLYMGASSLKGIQVNPEIADTTSHLLYTCVHSH